MWQACISCLGSNAARDDSGDDIADDIGDVIGESADHDAHGRPSARSAQAGHASAAVSGRRQAEAAVHSIDGADLAELTALMGSAGWDDWEASPGCHATLPQPQPQPQTRPEGPGVADLPAATRPQVPSRADPGSPQGLAPVQPPARSALPRPPHGGPPPAPRAPQAPSKVRLPPPRDTLSPPATVQHPKIKIGAAALLRAASLRAPTLAIRNVDLSHWTPSQVEAQPAAERAAMAARCERLHLPKGCSADVIRSWLRASPHLRELTAADIDDDGEFLSALHSKHLRHFRTTPPGPRALCIGLQTQVVIPLDRVTPPDRTRLQAWVERPDTLPMLSDDDFARLRRVLESCLFESASRYRRGVWLVGGVRRAMLDLMTAAPAELLSGVAAQNYHEVLARVERPVQQRMSYGEFLHFLRPTLLACWHVVAVPRLPYGHALRSREEVWRGAVLRHWVLKAPEGESVGERERIAASLVVAGRLQHPGTLQSLLLSPAPMLDDDSQPGSCPSTASQPASPVTPVTPVSSASPAYSAGSASAASAASAPSAASAAGLAQDAKAPA